MGLQDGQTYEDQPVEHAAYEDESAEPRDGDTCELDDTDHTGYYGTPQQGGSSGQSTSRPNNGTLAPRRHAPVPTPYNGARNSTGMTHNWTADNAKTVQGGQPMRTTGQGTRTPITSSHQNFGVMRSGPSSTNNRMLQMSHRIQRNHAAKKELSEVVCFDCNKKGHYRKDCPTAPRTGRPPAHTFSPHRAHLAEETGTLESSPQNAFFAGTYFAVCENSDDEPESAEEDHLAETGLLGDSMPLSITAPFSGACGFAAAMFLTSE
jgi:hypothetical protein